MLSCGLHMTCCVTSGQMCHGLNSEHKTDDAALEIFREKRDSFHAVVTDRPELCQSIRHIHPKIPIVVLTILSSPEAQMALKNMGATKCMLKPVYPKELERVLLELMEKEQPQVEGGL
mmetsp:Transcript_40225/g.104190  ORF Transcript_40225/g.104190 Transcript_40225/m.104190 type:complete len:118 (-) Transcript_40225:3704-4057(-)